MKDVLKTTPPELIAIFVIILFLISYALYVSKLAENRCIDGAKIVAQKEGGIISQEMVNWCKNTF